jgi:hypothetical protein
MRTQLRQKIVFAAFIVTLVWGIYNNPFQKKSVEFTPDPSTDTETIQLIAKTSAAKPLPVEQTASKPWGHDPFRPILKQGTTATAQKTLRLSGIIFQGSDPIAIVNGRSVRVGDEIGNAKVIEITKKSITLDENGARKILTVGKG